MVAYSYCACMHCGLVWSKRCIEWRRFCHPFDDTSCVYLLFGVIGKAPWMERLFERKLSGNILFIIGNLCLESYLIQKYIFTDALNYLFPLNIPLIMSAVLGSAYLLHILSEVIKQIFDSKSFDWKELLLYKK